MKSDSQAPDPSKLLEAFLASGRSERTFAALVGSFERMTAVASVPGTALAQSAPSQTVA